MAPVIKINSLSKTFTSRSATKGVWGALKGVFRTKKFLFSAINDLSFEVGVGERIAFIGPNGAGKSTTIKMLTGILYPTQGSIEVLGLVPFKERKALGRQIGTVFGQRSQLWSQLPPVDTFELLRKVYDLDLTEYQKHLADLVDCFEIGRLMETPVRSLSLGERMRCELVASLLHKPKILFLDEPTIGLDVNAKLKIRSLLSHLSKNYGTTLFLTSHDTADIEQVCDRVIVLNHGTTMLDCSIGELKRRFAQKKLVKLATDQLKLGLEMVGVEVIDDNDYTCVCEIDSSQVDVGKLVHAATLKGKLKDVIVEDTSMDEIVRALYNG